MFKLKHFLYSLETNPKKRTIKSAVLLFTAICVWLLTYRNVVKSPKIAIVINSLMLFGWLFLCFKRSVFYFSNDSLKIAFSYSAPLENQFEEYRRLIKDKYISLAELPRAIEEVRKTARSAMPRILHRNVIFLITTFVFLILFLSNSLDNLEALSGKQIIKGITSQDSLIDHAYYISVSLITLGYGDNCPIHCNELGKCFAIAMNFITFFFIIISMSLILGSFSGSLDRLYNGLRERLEDCIY